VNWLGARQKEEEEDDDDGGGDEGGSCPSFDHVHTLTTYLDTNLS